MRLVPFFFDTYPRSRRPHYPRYRGAQRTRVVIVGGGLTGCACAASFAAAGVDVILLEADRIGTGATAASPGLLRQDLDASFSASADQHGLRVARHVWQGFRRASLDLAAALRRFGVRADLTPQDVLWFTRDGTEAARRLRREQQARREAGVESAWLTSRAIAAEAAISVNGAIRNRGDARTHRRPACSREAQVRRGQDGRRGRHGRVRRAGGRRVDRRPQGASPA